MKKRIIRSLLTIACCVTVALSAIPTAEAAMRASVVTGKVTLNGQVIDNKTAKYPLLIYSNITYFPMTYHLSRFMGVSADWNNGSKTLDITAGGARTAYRERPPNLEPTCMSDATIRILKNSLQKLFRQGLSLMTDTRGEMFVIILNAG